MSEYPHDERIDQATYAPSATMGENLDDDLQGLHGDELDDFALPGGDEPVNDLDALDDDWEAELATANGSHCGSNDHHITDARRAIELHREQLALRAMLADGYADSWDGFDSGRTGH